jgi:hypothetical protein
MRALVSKWLLVPLVWGLDMFFRESHQLHWWDCGEHSCYPLLYQSARARRVAILKWLTRE